MNDNRRVFRYGNDIYTKNRDMLAVYNAQNIEIDVAGEEDKRAFLNNFLKTCDVEGIRKFEKIFEILADELTETLEFRRARILNLLIQQPPYTEIFLNLMLEELFGADKYSLQVLHNEYKIKIDIETEIDGLFNETISRLKKHIIPANMVMEIIQIEKYIHIYLKRHYTHQQMEQFTYGELSQYAEAN